jgi:hypothetical protein
MFIGIELPGVQMKSFNVNSEKRGIWLAEGMMKRWNQPSCTVYKMTLKKDLKSIAELVNEEYDPEKPILTADDIKPTVKPERKKKRSNRKVASSTATKGSTGGGSSVYKVPLAAIAEKLDKDPAALRRKLRKSNIEKPDGGWGWDDWNDPAVKEIMSWR